MTPTIKVSIISSKFLAGSRVPHAEREERNHHDDVNHVTHSLMAQPELRPPFYDLNLNPEKPAH